MVKRTYGWRDEFRNKPVGSHLLFSMGECHRIVVNAAILQCAQNYKFFALDDPLFALLKIKPHDKIVDDRVNQITLRHVLNRQTGWQGAPLELAAAEARKHGHLGPLTVDILLPFLMCQNLKQVPGVQHEDCPFCAEVLRYTISSNTGHSVGTYLRRYLGRPRGVTEPLSFQSIDDAPMDGNRLQVWNAKDTGPISASASALGVFMNHCRWDGKPRTNDTGGWWWSGDLNSTVVMCWRPDGINWVILFNGRIAAKVNMVLAEIDLAIENMQARDGIPEHPAKKSMRNARVDCENAWEAARAPLLAGVEKAEAKANKDGALDKVKMIRAQKHAFLHEGNLPTIVSTHRYQHQARSEMNKLNVTYAEAVNKFEKLGYTSLANTARREFQMVKDGRFLWTHDRGSFTHSHADQWIEKFNENGREVEYHFDEIGRNDDYIEVVDRSRDCFLRLYDREVLIKHVGAGNHVYGLLYNGHWHRRNRF